MRVFRSLVVPATILMVLGAGCADEPTSVGAGLLPPVDFLKADSTILPASSSSSVRTLPLQFVNRTRLLVGKSGTTESWGLLLFSFTNVDTLKDVSVQGAFLKLRTNYHFGDSSGQFSLIVRKALRTWTSVYFTYDSLRAAGAYEPTATPNQNFASIGDTDDVLISVDTAVVGSWLRNINETENTNFGIVLEPTNTTVIKGFASNSSINIAEQRPTLEFRYTRSGSSSIDTARIIASVERFVATSSDTSFTTDSTTVSVHNGLTYRGKLDFETGSIPAHAAILKATLEITRNPASSSPFNSYTTDSLLAITMTPFGFPEDTPDLRFASPSVSEVITVNGQRVYRFSVTEFVQSWVRGFPARSIAIAGIAEANSVDIFAFHGPASATAALRPRIIVIYSSPQ